jgi:hypothetical protein
MALPYGYTLTVWCSGELVRHEHPQPTVADIVLFVAGAVFAYGALRLSAGETDAASSGAGRHHLLRAGVVHLSAIAAAVSAAYGLGHLPALWAWPLTALGGTTAYLVIVAVELAFESDQA